MTKPQNFDELNALVHGIADALHLGEQDVIKAFEENRVQISFALATDGRKVIDVCIDGKMATIGLGSRRQ